MQLEGKLFRANLMIQMATVSQPDTSERFVVQLERAFIQLCRQLEMPLPIWMEKNTKEFARFHQTLFFAEQFTDPITFERFQIRWIE
jgi:hypothetical protein